MQFFSRTASTRFAVTLLLLLGATKQAAAQTATVTLGSEKQYIRGFGGMVHIPWAGDLTAAERTLAFGNETGQLGFTILRIAVPDGSTTDSSYVSTAKAAIAAGGIVFATPWNGSGSMNSADFSSYANHLSGFVSHMKSQGAELYAISVQNEPDYATQSGWKAWTPAQCHDFVLNYGDKIGTKLMSCESFNYTKSYYDPILNDSAALDQLGVLGTHLYGTAVNSYPYPLFDQKAAGKERWMTEHYTDSTTDANAWPNALNVATELHNAMVQAQFNAYTWWYIKRSYGPINSGAVTKRGWCMAHWSKFVRPGFHRVDATASPTSGVSLSAFKGDTDVVIVLVNTNSATKSVSISVEGGDISSYDRFTTSSSKSLASEDKITASGGTLSVTLDAQSVTTLHGSGTVPGGGSGAGGTGGSKAAAGDGGAASRGVGGGGAVVGNRGGARDAGRADGSGASAPSTPAGGSGGASPHDEDSKNAGGAPSTGGTGKGGSATSAVAGAKGGGSGASDNPEGLGSGAAGTRDADGAGPTNGLNDGEDGTAVPGPTGCQCRMEREHQDSKPFGFLGMLSVLGIRLARRRPKDNRPS